MRPPGRGSAISAPFGASFGVGADEHGAAVLVGVQPLAPVALLEEHGIDAAFSGEGVAEARPLRGVGAGDPDAGLRGIVGCGGFGRHSGEPFERFGEASSGRMHDEVEGAAAALSCDVIEEFGSVDADDGAFAGPFRAVARVGPEAEGFCDRLERDGPCPGGCCGRCFRFPFPCGPGGPAMAFT